MPTVPLGATRGRGPGRVSGPGLVASRPRSRAGHPATAAVRALRRAASPPPATVPGTQRRLPPSRGRRCDGSGPARSIRRSPRCRSREDRLDRPLTVDPSVIRCGKRSAIAPGAHGCGRHDHQAELPAVVECRDRARPPSARGPAARTGRPPSEVVQDEERQRWADRPGGAPTRSPRPAVSRPDERRRLVRVDRHPGEHRRAGGEPETAAAVHRPHLDRARSHRRCQRPQQRPHHRARRAWRTHDEEVPVVERDGPGEPSSRRPTAAPSGRGRSTPAARRAGLTAGRPSGTRGARRRCGRRRTGPSAPRTSGRGIGAGREGTHVLAVERVDRHHVRPAGRPHAPEAWRPHAGRIVPGRARSWPASTRRHRQP